MQLNKPEQLNNKLFPEASGPEGPRIDGVYKYHQFREETKNYLDKDFINEMDKHKELFQETLELTEKDLEMLMIMYHFDKATFEHSIKTLSIIKDKVHKPLEKGIVLADGIKGEVQNMEIFYRACLFHDIGKIAIPEFVLTNKLKDEDWAKYLLDLINDKNDSSIKNNLLKYSNQAEFIFEKLKSAESSSEIVQLLKDFDLRPCQIVPVKYGISDSEAETLLNDFGISAELSLWEIIATHEVESSNILVDQKFEKEAEIAGDHGKKTTKKNPISSTSLKIGSRMSYVKDLVYMGDIQEALLSKRAYRNPDSQIEVMTRLVNDAKKNKIDKVVTFLWLKDDMKLLETSEKGKEMLAFIKKNDRDLNPDELKAKKNIQKDLAIINSFFDCLCII